MTILAVLPRRIEWPRVGGARGAFNREIHQATLSITILEDPETPLSESEAAALALIREFSSLSTIDVVDTKAGTANHVTFSSLDPSHDLTAATVLRRDERVQMAVHGASCWPDLARSLTNGSNIGFEDLLVHIPVIELHRQQYRQILATNSRVLHDLGSNFGSANLRTFQETAQILGLYLRSRGDFTWRVFPGGSERIDREWFYSMMCCARLPAMAELIRGWSTRAKSLGDGSEYLAGSVFGRCARALRARDEVGFAFYADREHETRDVMTYHFDYLTMLLAGALDAQARMAHALYELSTPRLQWAAFHREDFVTALRKAGADELVAIAASERFVAFRQFLGALRNTIHGTGLTELGAESQGEPRRYLLRVHGKESQTVWESARILGNPADFGITRLLGTELEPYKCAVSLTALALETVSRIAQAMRVMDKLPATVMVPEKAPLTRETVAMKARIGALG